MEFGFDVFNLAVYRSKDFVNLFFRIFVGAPVCAIAENLESLKNNVGPLLRQPFESVSFVCRIHSDISLVRMIVFP